jgi:hypothetical protein
MNLLVSVHIAIRESRWRYVAFQFKCISHKWRSLSSSVSLPLSCFSVIKCFVPQIASSSAFPSQSRNCSASHAGSLRLTYSRDSGQGAAYGRVARFPLKPWIICKETQRNNVRSAMGSHIFRLRAPIFVLRNTRDHQ